MGNEATVRLVAYPGQTFSGEVIRVNPTVETEAERSPRNGANRQFTYTVWIAIDNLDELPPGLQGFAQFNQTQVKSALLIPESAITHLSNGEGMVMVVEEGQTVVKKIRVGRVHNNQREILEGISPDTEVLLYPRAINPGDNVTSIPGNPETATNFIADQK